MKVSPGPWKLDLSRTAGYVMSGNFCVASLGDSAPPRDANAKLICAAPKLLAALEKAESFLAGFEDCDVPEDRPSMLGEVRGAIAEAKGDCPPGWGSTA